MNQVKSYDNYKGNNFFLFFFSPSLSHPLDLCLMSENLLLLLRQPLNRDLHHAHVCDHLLGDFNKTSALLERLTLTELLPRLASLCIPCPGVGGRLAGSR